MNPSDQDRASELGRLWDGLARGDAPSGSAAGLLADIQFVQEVTAVPFPPPALRARIWQRVGERDLAATVSTTVVVASPNGAAHRPEPVATPARNQATPSAAPGWQPINWATLYWLLAIGVLSGFGAGAVAGIWTRLAMRLAGFMTIDQNRRLLTESDAVVGEITLGGTLFLGVFAGIVGIGGGLLYLIIRNWLPPHPMARAVIYGALLFIVFGFVLMDEGNPDYQRFGPAWLNVGTFSLTYLVYGILCSLVAERLIARLPRWTIHRAGGWRARFARVAMTPFGAVGLLAIAVIVVTGTGNAASAILASIILLFSLSRLIQLPAWNPGAFSPAIRRAGVLATLVPGLFGAFLTFQGVVGILTG